MPRRTLDDLLAFVAVAREGSFTKAAAKLGVSQSALSHTIRGLEERLGLRLLTRTTRSVAPTEAGERLLRTVGPRFDEIEGELAALSELREKPAGTIRITATENAADSLLVPKLAPLLREYPDIKVEIMIDYGLTDIVAERFDAGVRSGEQVAQGHDRGAHRAGHAHGGRRRAVVFPQARGAEDAAGPHRPQLHQPAPADARRALRLGVREERPRAARARRGPARLQRRNAHAQRGARGLRPRLRAGEHDAGPRRQGPPQRVLEDWCAPYSGYHLFYPSRRQSTPAFALLVDALRYRT